MGITYFSKKTPAAPVGAVNVVPQSDGQTPQRISFYVPAAAAAAPGVVKLEPALDVTKFLSGAGTWLVPAGGGGGGHTVLSGLVDPGPGDGADGDFWINITSWYFFGPKAAGVWPAGVSLVGPPGAPGAPGADGVGVPAGGAAGQVLTKIDAADYNTHWTTPGAGGGGGGIYPAMTTPLVADFTREIDTNSKLTAQDKTNRMVITMLDGTTTVAAGLFRALGVSAPYTVEMGFSLPYQQVGIAPGFSIGLKLYSIADDWASGPDLKYGNSTTISLGQARWTASLATRSEGSFSSQLTPWPAAGVMWMRITNDGTTYKYWVSQNGRDWMEHYEIAVASDFLGHTPTEAGLVVFFRSNSVTVPNSTTPQVLQIPVHHFKIYSGVQPAVGA